MRLVRARRFGEELLRRPVVGRLLPQRQRLLLRCGRFKLQRNAGSDLSALSTAANWHSTAAVSCHRHRDSSKNTRQKYEKKVSRGPRNIDRR